jgi:hypothetical protein
MDKALDTTLGELIGMEAFRICFKGMLARSP